MSVADRIYTAVFATAFFYCRKDSNKSLIKSEEWL